MIQMLKYLLDFLKHPTYNRHSNQKIQFKLKWLLFLLVIELPVSLLLSVLLEFLSKLGIFDIEENLIIKFLTHESPYLVIFAIALLGPILEELFFRLPLRLSRNNLLTALILAIIGLFSIYSTLTVTIPAWILSGLIFLLILFTFSIYFRNVYLT